MIFIGNYKEWVKDEYVEFMSSNDGTSRPGGGPNPDSEEFKIATAAGYNLTSTYWYIYEPHTFPFELTIPFDNHLDNIWWGIKMNPGNFMPMHTDPHTHDFKNCKRYWIAMQDYVPGHIFQYKDEILTNYKKGDIFQYPDANEIHGAANISYTKRLTFHFSTYERD